MYCVSLVKELRRCPDSTVYGVRLYGTAVQNRTLQREGGKKQDCMAAKNDCPILFRLPVVTGSVLWNTHLDTSDGM